MIINNKPFKAIHIHNPVIHTKTGCFNKLHLILDHKLME